ncbi:MAG TPA: hypothetical protein PKY50_02295 [Candidatus Competibacter sp.]|nr:hypothetical protein [Candidatus Competibacter sp.]
MTTPLTTPLLLALPLGVAAIFEDPKNSNINFSIIGISIRPSYFVEVGKAIRDGGIAIEIDPKLAQGDAIYFFKTNKIVLKSYDFNDLLLCALIIHEGVHAINDIKKRSKIATIDDEVAAFVAQALYVRGHGYPASTGLRLTDNTDKKKDAVFQKAFLIADLITARKSFWQEWIDLRAAIKAVPDYAGSLATPRAYKGIKK